MAKQSFYHFIFYDIDLLRKTNSIQSFHFPSLKRFTYANGQKIQFVHSLMYKGVSFSYSSDLSWSDYPYISQPKFQTLSSWKGTVRYQHRISTGSSTSHCLLLFPLFHQDLFLILIKTRLL